MDTVADVETELETVAVVKTLQINTDTDSHKPKTQQNENEMKEKTEDYEMQCEPTAANISELTSQNQTVLPTITQQTNQLSLDQGDMPETEQTLQGSEIDPNIRIKMLARISVSDGHFKHQQRGEPELTLQEKIEISQNILDSNKVIFLSKFGKYLQLEDLEYFKPYRGEYEIDFFIKQITKSRSGTYEKNVVKNRRYEAMKELISKGEYFSDEEMKFRDPYLYEQMVGQYLTDDEVQAKVDKSDLRFSTILIAHIDQLDENVRYYQDKDKEEGQEEEEETDEEEDEESEMEDDDRHEYADEGKKKKKITDAHKKELKAEFLTCMQERFLRGEDKEFDYSKVDNNDMYDDMTVLNNDAEEKYFDDEDPESINSDSNT